LQLSYSLSFIGTGSFKVKLSWVSTNHNGQEQALSNTPQCPVIVSPRSKNNTKLEKRQSIHNILLKLREVRSATGATLEPHTIGSSMCHCCPTVYVAWFSVTCVVYYIQGRGGSNLYRPGLWGLEFMTTCLRVMPSNKMAVVH
jgi:hypothetical protein